jgi:hypothetical protein
MTYAGIRISDANGLNGCFIYLLIVGMEFPLLFHVITAIKESTSLISDDNWWGLAFCNVYIIFVIQILTMSTCS